MHTPLSRRTILATMGVAGAAGLVPAAANARPRHQRTIVGANGPQAAVVLGTDAGEEATHGAEDIVAYVEASTGVVLPIVTPAEAAELDPAITRLFIGGAANDTRRVRSRLSEVSGDGFVIDDIGSGLLIAGATDRATRFGCYHALEQFVGVRWLMPGEFGTHVPQRDDISFPAGISERHQPAFGVRTISPVTYRWDASRIPPDQDNAEQQRWGAYQRSAIDLRWAHGLWRWLPTYRYANPDDDLYDATLFPLIDGVRHVPPPGSAPNGTKAGWQPRFSHPGLAAIVADNIIAAVDANPTSTYRKSVELSVHDNRDFSDDDLDFDHLNEFGQAQASEKYYTFVNEVAERVGVAYPDIKFGVLAYLNVSEPPSFQLHPNVVPMLTRERLGWADPDFAARDRDHTQHWLTKANEVGWYDYRYGWRYPMPRVDVTVSGEAYRWAKQAGVKHSYAEARLTGQEGSKGALAMRQAWDPDFDTDEFRRDWAEAAVGVGAAADLVAYEDLWDTTWRTTVADTGWFHHSLHTTPFFRFTDDDFLAAIDEETVQQARTLLDRVRDNAQTAEQQQRVAFIERSFRYGEASILAYPRPVSVPRSLEAAQALLEHSVSTLDRNIALAIDRMDLFRNVAADPLVNFPPIWGAEQRWPGFNAHPLWAIGRWLEEPIFDSDIRSRTVLADRLRRRLEHLAGTHESPHVRAFASGALAVADGAVIEACQNPSFENETLQPWVVGSTGKITDQPAASDQVSYHSGRSLRIGLPFGINPRLPATGHVGQTISVEPGEFLRTSIRYFTETSDAVFPTSIRLVWELRDAAGHRVNTFAGLNQSVARTQGEWGELAMVHLIPETVVTVDVRIEVRNSRLAAGALYLDDAHFQQTNRA